MVLHDGTWNWVLLKQFVRPSVIPHLLSIPPHAPSAGRDRPTWADEWLFSNLKINRLHLGTHIPWRILFASLVWQLWKRRNSILFANIDMTNDALQRLSYSWASHFISSSPASASPTPPMRELVQWSGAG
ncbi:hypothetical protein V6N11_036615 [Hibiscus sabdariffa]|uniref:Uncharacterized protein n=1 Tax=Hibiscus sabdariffa TaxID=183260 RepID=A0ABR2RB88_9ROSI